MSFKNDVVSGDKITAGWMNAVEDGLGGHADLTDAQPSQGASYVVFKSGSTHYARDGHTGKLDFDDATFSTLMNEVILDMFDSGNGPGGKIHIKPMADTYEVTSSINMRPGINVFGEVICGDVGGTELSTTLQATADTEIFLFNYPSGSNKHYFGGLHYLNLEGYGTTGTASKANIDIVTDSNHCSDTKFTHLYSHDGRYGMRIYNNAAATYKIWNIFIDRCMFEANDYNGLLIDSPTNQIIERVIVTHGHYYNNCQTSGNGGIEIDGHSTYCGTLHHNTFDQEEKHSIYLNDEADHWIIDSNIIKDTGAAAANTYSGIYCSDVDYINITGNTVADITTSNTKYGLYIDASSTYINATGNIFAPVQSGGWFMHKSNVGTGINVPYDANILYEPNP